MRNALSFLSVQIFSVWMDRSVNNYGLRSQPQVSQDYREQKFSKVFKKLDSRIDCHVQILAYFMFDFGKLPLTQCVSLSFL